MEDWKGIYLISFERARDKTNSQMSHFITKCMSNTLYTMRILLRQRHASINLCPCCGMVPETIHHLYQRTHEGSSVRWTSSVETFWKWLETCNMDPEILTLFFDELLYITGEGNDLTQCTNLNLHSDTLLIVWTYIVLGFINKSLARTKQMDFNHKGSKKGTQMGQPTHHTNLETHLRTMDPTQ